MKKRKRQKSFPLFVFFDEYFLFIERTDNNILPYSLILITFATNHLI